MAYSGEVSAAARPLPDLAGPEPRNPGPDAADWVGVCAPPLPIDQVGRWVPAPDCGAVVQFLGTVRDHSEGRPGVVALDYEAYVEECDRRLELLVAEARRRWPSLGRVAALHAVGELAVGEAAVVVSVASPHRLAAFEAARYLIDTLKATLPIWKRERWSQGEDWSTSATPVAEVPRSEGGEP